MKNGTNLSTTKKTRRVVAAPLFVSVLLVAAVALSFPGTAFSSTTQWEVLGTSNPGSPVVALSNDGTNLFAGCDNGTVYAVPLSGGAWSQFGSNTPGSIVWALSNDGTNLFAGCDAGTVYSIPLSGGAWSQFGSNTPAASVFALSNNGTNLFAGCSGGTVYSIPLSGGAWSQYGSNTPAATAWALSHDGTNLFAGSTNGNVYYIGLPTHPTVTTTAISNVTSTTADSGGNVTSDGGATVTHKGVCRSTSPNPTTADSKTDDGTGTGTFTSELTGLSPGTTYHARAYATNSVGTSYGADLTFTTFSPPPVQTTTWYLAEGTNAWGFSTYVTIENPNNDAVTAKLTYMDSNPSASGKGVLFTRTVALPPLSQTTVSSQPDIGEVDFSAKVKCLQGKTIAVDRTMFWTGEGYSTEQSGYHNSIGAAAPSKVWYLPEGSSAWGFETWALILNPNPAQANVTLIYMTEGGPVAVNKTVPPNSRATYSMAQDLGREADASIQVTSNVPVVAERSMYRDSRREGSCSIGVTAPATDYFLAEGACGYDVSFTTWVLIQNSNNAANDVTLTYQTQSGEVAGPSFTMQANTRRTVRVNDRLPANTNVSTQVHGSQPLIAERAMYWDNGTGEAFHASIGLDSPHMSFYLPDGQTSDGFETWTLIQNPNPGSVTVRITCLPQGGGTPVSFTSEIPKDSRATFNMAEKMGEDSRASILVDSLDGARPVMVERAMYANNRGGGTDTIGAFSDHI